MSEVRRHQNQSGRHKTPFALSLSEPVLSDCRRQAVEGGSPFLWTLQKKEGASTSSARTESGWGRPGCERNAQQGFTLIELLVALAIFGLLASAGVMLLRGSVQTQQAVIGHLDALADVQRGLATLDSDLAQATVRISRTEAGTLAPAFFGRKAQDAEPIMQFVRGGWSNPNNQRHPSIQKVEYWWREGRIERIGYQAVDGAKAPEPATLFENVTALELRYRTPAGEWLDVWAPSLPEQMPVAVEMVVTRKGEPPFTLRFLVGAAAGQLPEDPMAQPQEGSNGV